MQNQSNQSEVKLGPIGSSLVAGITGIRLLQQSQALISITIALQFVDRVYSHLHWCMGHNSVAASQC